MNRLLSGKILACLSLLIAACGGGPTDGFAPNPSVEGLLKQVNDPMELEQSIKSGFTVLRTQQELSDAQAALAAAANGNFTGTYTQEARVDEFDAVRYDGAHLYVAPRRYYHCCFIAADASGGTGSAPDRSIRILETDPKGGSATLTRSRVCML
jgi:hypothetical protein